MFYSDLHIFFTVNCGLFIKHRDFSCLIDGLHAGHSVGFSNFPDSLRSDLVTGTGIFDQLDIVLFTHLHPDHFDGELLEKCRLLPSPPDVFCPDVALCNIPKSSCPDSILYHTSKYSSTMNAIRQIYLTKDISIYAIKTVHDGECFRNVDHYSYLLQIAGETLLIAGDAGFSEADAQIFLGITPRISIAFVNIFQLSTKKRRTFLEALSPKTVCLYHLPFPEDDQNKVHILARRILKRLSPGFPDTRILTPMSQVLL